MKIYLWLAVALLLGACSFGDKEPLWITEKPSDAEYYNAVVRYSSKAPDYVQAARENALREISTQISVNIDSDIYLNETELNGIPSSELKSRIRLSSNNKLKDVQLVGSYETEKDYWAYYRLSKSEYRAWRMGQKELALTQAKGLLEEYDTISDNACSGISALLKAMELVVDFTDLDLSVVYHEQKVNIYNEIFKRVNELPSKLLPIVDTPELDVVAKQRQNHLLETGMLWLAESGQYHSVSFPLSARFKVGKGELTEKLMTGENGTAELTLKRVTEFSNPQEIAVAADKRYWLQNIQNPVVKDLFNRINLPEAVVKLNVRRPRAYIDYSFNGAQGSAYRELLLNKLMDLDLEVVNSREYSDFSFKVGLESHESDYVPRLKLYSSLTDAFVELSDTKSGKRLYSTDVTAIKSTGANKEQALRNSEYNGIKEICDMVLYSIVEQYIMN